MIGRFDPDGRLSFDEATHVYALDGEPVISVTQAIGESFAGLMGERFYHEQARLRGAAVHKAIMLEAEGTLDESTVHPIVRPYFEAFRAFVRDQQPRWIATEQRVYDDVFRYAGALDALLVFEGPMRVRPWAAKSGFDVLDLTDWKSGHLPWTVGMQTAGYRRCIMRYLPARTIIRRWALQLAEDASYHLECVSEGLENEADERDFLAAVRVAQIRRRHTRRTEDSHGYATANG